MHGLSSAYDGLSKMLLLNCVGVINKVDIYAMRLLGCYVQPYKTTIDNYDIQ
jgi:hypothetical protein